MANKNYCLMCHESFEEGTGRTVYLTGHEKIEDACCSSECADKYKQKNLEDTVAPLIKTLCNIVNGGSPSALGKALAMSLMREHRYLQAELVNAIAMFCGEYSTEGLEKNRMDARNEAACHQAKRMNVAAYNFSD